MLLLVVFLQVLGFLEIEGILSSNSSEIPLSLRNSRKATNRSVTNWQTILKDATFQTLVKHTGFTPSLDEKIETDRLLWEKIHGAKFLRKNGKSEESDQIKMGVLIDMTHENGQLEFRQTDRSLYNCEGNCKNILSRLIAIWRIQKFEPNDIWIKIKLPKGNEDVYEYTTKLGLKQLTMADSYLASKMKSLNKHKVWKGSEDIKILNIDERIQKKDRIDRDDRQFYDMEDIFRQITKPRNYQKPKQLTFTIQAPNMQFIPHIIGLTVPPNPAKHYSWNNGASYYQVDPINMLSEFQKGDPYNGFLPSTGPTGSSFFQSTIPPYTYPEIPYSWKQTTQKIPPPKNFKPSVELVNYSELDPFYHENESDKFITITTTRPVQNDGPKPPFPSSINEQLPKDEIEQTTKTEAPVTTSTTNIPSTKKTKANRPREIKSSAESNDYAPLYMKWGDKIKSKNTQTQKNLSTTTQKSETKINETITAEELTSQNVKIENIEEKSPEEVVNTLTNIGVHNSTRIEGYPEISDKLIEKSNSLIKKLKEDQASNNSDPISIIINRISQSYSYKTSTGKVRSLKKI